MRVRCLLLLLLAAFAPAAAAQDPAPGQIGNPITVSTLEDVTKLPKECVAVKVFQTSDAIRMDSMLKDVCERCELKYADLAYSRNLTDDGLKALAGETALEQLGLASCPKLSATGLGHLTGLTKLQLLVVSNNEWVEQAALEAIGKLAGLRVLQLAGCKKLADTHLAELSKLPALELLYLLNCPQLGKGAFANLAKVPALRCIELTGTSPSAKALVALSASKTITELAMNEYWLDQERAQALTKFAELRLLQLVRAHPRPGALAVLATLPKLEILTLQQADCSDAGIVALATAPALKHLVVSGNDRFTDYGLAALARSKTLLRLDATECRNLSEDGIAAFKKALPACQLNTNWASPRWQWPAYDPAKPLLVRHIAEALYLPADVTQVRLDSQSEPGLLEFLARHPQIEWLEVYLWPHLDIEQAEWPARLPKLKTLSIHGLNYATFSLEKLAACPALVELSLNSMKDASDASLKPLAGIATLRTLALRNCPEIHGETLGTLNQLTSLTLYYIGLKPQTFAEVGRMAGLEELEVNGVAKTGKNERVVFAADKLAGLSKLRHLRVIDCITDDNTLKALMPLTALQNLDLAGFEGTGTGFEALASIPGLVVLDLDHSTRVTEEHIPLLAGLRALRELNLVGCRQLGDKTAASLAGHPTLARLRLDAGKLTNAAWASLGSMTRLEQLEIYGGARAADSAFDGQGIEALGACKELRNLNLCGTTFSATAYEQLGTLTQLTSLELNLCSSLDDVALKSIGKLTSLRKLCVTSCQNLTDAGIAHLAGLTELEHFEAGGASKITGASVSTLVKWKKVKELWLGGTGLSAANKADLRKALPGARVF